jgi:hypothetical protein
VLLRVPLTGEELDKISAVPVHLICDLGFVCGKKKVNWNPQNSLSLGSNSTRFYTNACKIMINFAERCFANIKNVFTE